MPQSGLIDAIAVVRVSLGPSRLEHLSAAWYCQDGAVPRLASKPLVKSAKKAPAKSAQKKSRKGHPALRSCCESRSIFGVVSRVRNRNSSFAPSGLRPFLDQVQPGR